MNFFNDLYVQARAALTAMPAANRLIAVGLVIAIAVGLGLLVNNTNGSSGEYLFGGRVLDDGELDRAEFAFSQAELRSWERVGNRLRVPSKFRDQYLRALAEANALPRDLDWATQEAVNNFSPFETNAQRQDRLALADRQALQESIKKFPEVQSVYLKPAVSQTGLGGQRTQSASVVVTPRGAQMLTPARIDDIRKLVAAAYPGMNSDNVHVTDTNAQVMGASWIDDDDPYYRKKKQTEQDYETRIHNLLDAYQPIRLAVSVELDPTLNRNTSTLNYTGNPATVAERTTSRTSENVKPNAGGVPGVASNAYGNKPTTLSPERDQTSKLSESNEAADRVVGHEQTNTEVVGLTEKRVSASIGIPESFYERAYRREWLLENPTKSEADTPPMTAADRERVRNITNREIQEAVVGIFPPVGAGDDRFPLVTVWDYPDLPTLPVVEPSPLIGVTQWLAQSWQTMLLVVVALVALVMLRSFVKTPAEPNAPDFKEGFGLAIPALPEDELAISGEGDGAMLEISGKELKSQLTEMIESNPDAAANILRLWIEDDISENAAA